MVGNALTRSLVTVYVRKRRPLPDRAAVAPALAATAPARLISWRFLRGYVITMRPYLLFVSGITGMAGLALAPRASWSATALLAAAFFLSYGFGQALTDCFQMDTDALSAPYRPLVQGLIGRRDVLVVSLAGLIAIGLAFTLYNPVNLVLAGVAVVGLASYTPFKRRWWAGPFYNAWIVAVLALIGYTAGTGAATGTAVDVGASAAPLALGAMLAGVFFGYANFVLTGYYKDISADRATGYRTLPVVYGLRVSAVVSDGFALFTLVACAVAIYAGLAGGALVPRHAMTLPFFGAGSLAAVLAQLRLHRVRDEAAAHRAIAPVVHAYILLLAAVAVAHRPGWAEMLVVFYLAFLLAMRLRPLRQQI